MVAREAIGRARSADCAYGAPRQAAAPTTSGQLSGPLVVAVGLIITPASADVLRKTKKGMVKARAPRASLARRQLDMAALGLQVAGFAASDKAIRRPAAVASVADVLEFSAFWMAARALLTG